MLLELVQGLALLLALCFLYGALLRLFAQAPRLQTLSAGLLFGAITALGMWAPLYIGPGVFIDARSVVLSMAALVCGPWVALLASAIAALLRWWLGGAGMAVGLLTIACSSGLGLLYRYAHQRWRLSTGPLALLLFGLLLDVLLWALFQWTAPATTFEQQLALPFVLVFGLASACLGWLLQDLQQRQRTEIALASSERRLHTLLNDLPAISVQGYRADGTTVYWNKASEQLYGYSAQEALGKNLLDLIIPTPLHANVRQAMAQMFASGEPIAAGELRLRHKDGHGVDVFSSHAYLPLPGQAPEMFCLDIDLSARKAAEEQARFLAQYDPLTELPNRRLLSERLQQALAASARSSQHGALLCLDIDQFKTLNDSQGHAAGDQLLVLLAQRLQGCVREHDTVARSGGDEFIVLLTALAAGKLEAAAQTRVLGERILQALRQPCTIDGQTQHPRASMGATLFGPEPNLTAPQELLQQADMAMYRAKAGGRDQMHFFDPTMQAAAHERQQLHNELHQALQAQELRLHYQPQVNDHGHIVGAEVLLRWQHPQRGLLAPGLFIPLAEETGQILALGQWVLQEALAQQARWRELPALQQINLSINVSARQFRLRDFVADLHELLQRSGAQAHAITLELTESLLLQDVGEVITLMQALRSLGLQLSLDDFGTGYSSLSYLKRLPLTEVKIDQGFVRGMLHDPKDVAIARSIITLGQELGLKVLAEGVETQAHHELLRAHGCRHFQGYHFGRPMALAEFEALVLTQAQVSDLS